MFQNILVSLMDSIEKAIAERGLYKIVHDSRVNERTMQTHEGIISKDASEIDNNVAGASHDKDNITEIQILSLHYVKPDVHDTVEILNDAEEKLSLDESDVPPKEMPNEGKLLKKFVNLDNEIKKLVTFNLDFHMDKHRNEIKEEVKEMLDIFESMERNVARTSKKNEILQNKIDQLLEANLANDVKNLVMQSYVEIKNKEEIEWFSKESKDSEKFCNDVVEVKEKLSKQIVQLEKDFAKLEAQSIAFEIALQHKTQENNSLKTLQKENENFMASLQIENAHLKQTYKDLFESIQSSRVETIQCDEVKIKIDFEKIETQSIELEHQVASLLKENKHLKLTYQNLFDSIKKSRVQTKTSNVTQNEAENLKSQLFEFAETKFNNILGKIKLFKKNQFDSFSSLSVDCNSSDLEKESGEKNNLFENKTCVFQTKIAELEKTLAKQTKENSDLLMKIDNLENAFDDEEKRATTGKLTKFEAYFEKLENMKVVLERQLARKVDDSKAEKDQFLKEINHLRTQLKNRKEKSLETKFDKPSILGKPPLTKNEKR
ncbi:hypothetical protein Tco_0456085 [Tanacetum coccineum]